LEKLFIPVKKSRIIIYILFFIVIISVAITLQLVDKNSNYFWDIITYVCIILVFYLLYIYGKDLFSKKSGLYIEEKGIYLNLEYYKDILIYWKDITKIQSKRFCLLLNVRDPGKYLNQISKITGLLIRGNIKRQGTIFVIRYSQLNMNKDILLEKINQALKKYKKEK